MTIIVARAFPFVKNQAIFSSTKPIINNLQPMFQRFITSKKSSPLPFEGPAPSQPILPKEPGHDLVEENIDFFQKQIENTTITHSQIKEIQNKQIKFSENVNLSTESIKEIVKAYEKAQKAYEKAQEDLKIMQENLNTGQELLKKIQNNYRNSLT